MKEITDRCDSRAWCNPGSNRFKIKVAVGVFAFIYVVLLLRALPHTILVQIEGASPLSEDSYCSQVLPIPFPVAIVSIREHVDPTQTYPPHHAALYGCQNAVGQPSTILCVSSEMETSFCDGQQLLFITTETSKPLVLPSGMGIGNFKSIRVLLHYKYPAKADHSGFQLELGKTNAVQDWIQVKAFAPLYLYKIPPGKKSVPVSFCTENDGGDFMVIKYRVHAHGLGVLNTLEVYDGPSCQGKPSTVLKRSPQLPQAFIDVAAPFVFKSSQSVRVTCEYDSSHMSHVVYEGSTKYDEMCNFYLMGYAT